MNSLGPISPGNIINAAITLHRANYKTYFSLSLASILWNFIPIYGWAKSAVLQATIGCQIYKQLIGQPETVSETLSYINPGFWKFWLQQILISLYLITIFFLTSVGIGFMIGFMRRFLALFPNLYSIFESFYLLIILAYLFIFLFIVFIIVWCYSHLMFAEITLALEPGLTAYSSLLRSWRLSSGSIVHIQWSITIGSVVTGAVFSGVSAIGFPLIIILATVTSSSFSTLLTQAFIVGLATLILPFWQAIKAIIYYDLRCRREGLDIILLSPANASKNL